MPHFVSVVFTCIFAIEWLDSCRLFSEVFVLQSKFNCFSSIAAEKVTCENCGTQTAQTKQFPSHEEMFYWNTLLCAMPLSLETSQTVSIYHAAKKHARVQAKGTFKCKFCLEVFSGFHALGKRRSSQYVIWIKRSNIDTETLFKYMITLELKKSKYFKHFLVDSELKKGGHSVFQFTKSSFNNSLLNQKSIMCKCNSNLQLKLTLHSEMY